MTRSLVLTADDAGVDRDTDHEIGALLAGSPLTATTVIASGAPADAARAVGVIAQRAPDVAPGVHVVLPSSVPPGGFDDAAERITAQVEAVTRAAAACGAARPGRLDSHQGTLYGVRGRSYLAEAIGVCAERGLTLRLPRELDLYGDADPLLAAPDVRARHASAVVAADDAGVRLPRVIATHRGDVVVGAGGVAGYAALRDHYLRLLERLPQGVSEIFLHPAPDTAAVRRASPSWWRKRTWELRLLGDPVFRREIERQDIELVGGW